MDKEKKLYIGLLIALSKKLLTLSSPGQCGPRLYTFPEKDQLLSEKEVGVMREWQQTPISVLEVNTKPSPDFIRTNTELYQMCQ